MCYASEGKSPRTIEAAASAVVYFLRFLDAEGQRHDLANLNPYAIRAFILHLRQKRRFSGYPLNKPEPERGLSGHTLNCYLRSRKCFTNWCFAENLLPNDPFEGVKIPKPPKKVIAAFSEEQLAALLAATEPETARGFRNYTIILTLLDTGLRISELCSLKMCDVQLEEGILKVWGKGGKERQVPFGREVQKLLWRYLSLGRPEPNSSLVDTVFLTADGKPLNKDNFGAIMHDLGRKAGLEGVRCSPHTMRHTAAISFLRNGGDAFSLQRLLGHSSLEMTRNYCNIADVDLKRAHRGASPVDHLEAIGQRHIFHKGSPDFRQNGDPAKPGMGSK